MQLVFVSATIPTATEESLKELISVRLHIRSSFRLPFSVQQADQIDKALTPSVHRIMPHVPQKFYRIGNQQKLGLFFTLLQSSSP